MRLARLRAAVDRALEALLALLMASLVGSVLWQVFTRFALADPSSGTEELARFALIWLGLLGAAYAFGRRLHLSVDLLGAALGARPGGRAALDLLLHLCVAAFAAAILVGGGSLLVDLTLRLQQRSAALGIPLGAVYLALPLSGLLMLLYAALGVGECLVRLRRRG